MSIYIKYKLFFHNISYLAIVKVFMLVLPLLSYPYLIRVVGADNFGLLVYVLSIISFFRIFVMFGYELSGVKSVAQSDGDKHKLSMIISSILLVQLFLYFIGFLVLFFLIENFSQFKDNEEIFYYAYLLPLCDILSLIWFFQGIEKMKYITVVKVFSGLVGLVFILLFIEEEGDYIYIPLFQSLSMMLGSVFSLYFIFKLERVSFIIPSVSDSINCFFESLPFFLSRASGSFNSQVNTILLANFVGLSSVAYYDLAQKIIEVFKMPNSIINGVVYPHIAKTKDVDFAKKILYIRILIASTLIVIVNLFSEYFVLFLAGDKMLPTLDIIPIFSSMVLLTSITYYVGATLLVSFGYENKFNISVGYSTILYLFLLFVLYVSSSISIYNVIYVMLAAEIYVAVYRVWYCKLHKIL